jgi:hypothetical protein
VGQVKLRNSCTRAAGVDLTHLHGHTLRGALAGSAVVFVWFQPSQCYHCVVCVSARDGPAARLRVCACTSKACACAYLMGCGIAVGSMSLVMPGGQQLVPLGTGNSKCLLAFASRDHMSCWDSHQPASVLISCCVAGRVPVEAFALG